MKETSFTCLFGTHSTNISAITKKKNDMHTSFNLFQTVITVKKKPIDILFILDASGSVGSSNFNTMLDFVEKMVDGFRISSSGTQVGLITFASSVVLQFHLNRYHDKNDIKNAVSQTRYLPTPYRLYLTTKKPDTYCVSIFGSK